MLISGDGLRQIPESLLAARTESFLSSVIGVMGEQQEEELLVSEEECLLDLVLMLCVFVGWQLSFGLRLMYCGAGVVVVAGCEIEGVGSSREVGGRGKTASSSPSSPSSDEGQEIEARRNFSRNADSQSLFPPGVSGMELIGGVGG